MKLKGLIIFMMLFLLPVAMQATVECYISADGNLTWVNITSTRYGGCIDNDYGIGYIRNLEANTEYSVKCKDETTSFSYISGTTNTGGGGITMPDLSIMLTLGAITAATFYAGLKMNFTDSSLSNLIIKRCILILGLLFIALDLTVLASIVAASTLEVNSIIFTYLNIANWAVYVSMVILIISSTVNILKTWGALKERKSYGE